jgi:hypothetical protein
MAADMDTDFPADDEAYTATRSVKLTIGPNGVTYYLEPKYGHIRGIVCRRVDGVRIKCPDSLEGGYTDGRNALAAVDKYLASRGKAKPELRAAPVKDFSLPEAVNVHNEPEPEKDPEALKAEAEALAATLDADDEELTREPDAAELSLSVPQVDEDELEPEPEVPTTINLSEGKPDPEGETVTQKALRERLAAEAAPAVPAAKPKTVRKPRSKQA